MNQYSTQGSAFQKALRVVQSLRDSGHVAYFAGGWVRDYLLEKPSPDIDIATSAPPEVVAKLFPHTVEVGASFGVVMVIIADTPFEVATFRKDGLYLYGRRPVDVAYATPEEDAQRRDFTVNGMFYDPLVGEIFDYVGGREDLEKGIIRAIGDAHERFNEDRLRMVRGVRLMARFHFALERGTREAIAAHASNLFPSVAMERLWQEFTKMADHSGFGRALVTMHELGLLQVIFPQLSECTLDDIVHRTRAIRDFPHPCPAILCLLQLFPAITSEEATGLCNYLKTPTREALLAAWYLHVVAGCNGTLDDQRWVHIYADPRTNLCLQIYSVTLPKEQHASFVAHHQAEQARLQQHIERVQAGAPLVAARHLLDVGVRPGKQLGLLLKEAERLCIVEHLDTPESVLGALKRSSLWPEEA
jgi:poly(A) polymerase